MIFANTQALKDNSHSFALDSWPQWRPTLTMPPTAQCEILGGETNRTYLLNTHLPQQPHVILRLFSPRSSQLGIDRHREEVIHRAVAGIGLAPQVVHWDHPAGFCVLEAITGQTWSQLDFGLASRQQQLSQAIAAYQQVELDTIKPFDYVGHLDAYTQGVLAQLVKSEQRQWLAFRERLSHWQKQPWQPCISHHDLIPQNIISTKAGIRIIDWEYAGLGHGQFDRLDLPCEPHHKDRPLLLELRHWLARFWQLQ